MHISTQIQGVVAVFWDRNPGAPSGVMRLNIVEESGNILFFTLYHNSGLRPAVTEMVGGDYAPSMRAASALAAKLQAGTTTVASMIEEAEHDSLDGQ